MRTFMITVNGKSYEVEVEEITAGQQEARQTAPAAPQPPPQAPSAPGRPCGRPGAAGRKNRS